MSRALLVWDPLPYGVEPQSREEVSADFHRLSGLKVSTPNEKLLTFARQVSARLLVDDPENEDYRSYYETLEEDARGNSNALFAVDLPSEDWVPALQVMAEEAKALRLVMLDVELGMAFLSNGQVTPESMREVWEGALQELEQSNFPRRLSEFKKWFNPKFFEMLSKHGFIQVDGKFIGLKGTVSKRSTGGDQYISHHFDRKGSGFSVVVYIHGLNAEAQDIYNRFSFAKGLSAFMVNLGEINGWDDNLLSIFSYESGRRCITYIEGAVIPIFDKASNIKGLDSIMNGDFDGRLGSIIQNSPYAPYCLIVARLAGSIAFDALAVKLRVAKWTGVNEDAIKSDEWLKLVKYLREYVHPVHVS